MENGFRIVPAVLDTPTVARLGEVLADGGVASQRGESVYARRNLLALPEVAALEYDSRIRALTGSATCLTRALFFDKLPGANWRVPWHQDRAIAVAARQTIPGWGPWTVKAGVVHVLPPAEILGALVAVRLHLDPCDAQNGPLRVLPGSHREGILSAEQIQAWRTRVAEVVCVVPQGGAVVLSPLLLHASSPSVSPHHRRVLHLEFAPEGLLPEGVTWAH